MALSRAHTFAKAQQSPFVLTHRYQPPIKLYLFKQTQQPLAYKNQRNQAVLLCFNLLYLVSKVYFHCWSRFETKLLWPDISEVNKISVSSNSQISDCKKAMNKTRQQLRDITDLRVHNG